MIEIILGTLSIIAMIVVLLAIFYCIFYPMILAFKQRKMTRSKNEQVGTRIMLTFCAIAIILPFFVAFYLSATSESSAAGFGFAYTLIFSPFIVLLGLIIARKYFKKN